MLQVADAARQQQAAAGSAANSEALELEEKFATSRENNVIIYPAVHSCDRVQGHDARVQGHDRCPIMIAADNNNYCLNDPKDRYGPDSNHPGSAINPALSGYPRAGDRRVYPEAGVNLSAQGRERFSDQTNSANKTTTTGGHRRVQLHVMAGVNGEAMTSSTVKVIDYS